MAVSIGREDEHAAGRPLSCQVDVVARRTEAKVLPVAAPAQTAGRDDEARARKE